MGYELPKWKEVNRRRIHQISYKDPQFVKFYDLDQTDFSALALKLKLGFKLNDAEDYRYWMHIVTVVLQVLEKPEWKEKPYREKCDMYEFVVPKMLKAIPTYDPAKGSILNIAFQACKNGFFMFYRRKQQANNKSKRIQDHLDSCFSDYISEINSGKVNSQNYE